MSALKQVDIVISVGRGAAVLDGQLKLIEVIKEVGHKGEYQLNSTD